MFKMEEIMLYLCAVWNDPIEAKLMRQDRGGDIPGKMSLKKKEDKELPVMPCCYAVEKKKFFFWSLLGFLAGSEN